MSYPIKSPRKLIEVALPLDKINEAATDEKGNPFLKGHPRNLHQWWARRPLAAARAVVFAQMVNDPGYQQGGGFKFGKNKKEAAEERKRLFRILEELVQWENTSNERVLEEARAEIRRSWKEVCELNRDHPEATTLFNPSQLPGLHDPFAGGGAIPLEALRLGLTTFASDLNPVAVLINKAMIEIPPKFAGIMPIGPLEKSVRGTNLGISNDWQGSRGIAEDVRRYGEWINNELVKRVSTVYPHVTITQGLAEDQPDLKSSIGNKYPVLAWLWARTVKSPNPAFSNIDVPLISTFILSGKKSKETYIKPIISNNGYSFTIKKGAPPPEAKNGTKASSGGGFFCLMSETPISFDYIRSEAKAGRMGTKLMAIVVDTGRSRGYISPSLEQELIATQCEPSNTPDGNLPDKALGFRVQEYGMLKWCDLFTKRQLVGLTAISDLIIEAQKKIKQDYEQFHKLHNLIAPELKKINAIEYSNAISIYLSFALSKFCDYSNTICTWNPTNENIGHLFSKQSIPMAWDFVEACPLNGGLTFSSLTDAIARSIDLLPAIGVGAAFQENCSTLSPRDIPVVYSTDPPYYDNIGYADLSDFFYVWLRRTLKQVYPELFTTMTVPKAEELIASPFRHGNKEGAEAFFLAGMTQAMQRLAENAHPGFPTTIYYAFKQSDTGKDGTSSAGWETFLTAVIRAGFSISGTWPIRTERSARSVGQGTNSLASSVILVCRKRSLDSNSVSRREFIRELNAVLPEALDEMTKGTPDEVSPMAPVDLSQAIIGPGMAVFSKYAAVLEADGSPMSVRTALQLINRFLAEDDFDGDTQFCMHWFEQYGWKPGEFGQADVLARSKSTAVDGLAQAGVVEAVGGFVRLLKWAEYPTNWDPRTDTRLPIWEALHHLIRTLRQGGEVSAANVASALPGKMEAVRQLAYRLYTLCERQNWAEDARAYNELITSWSGIEMAVSNAQPAQRGLFD